MTLTEIKKLELVCYHENRVGDSDGMFDKYEEIAIKESGKFENYLNLDDTFVSENSNYYLINSCNYEFWLYRKNPVKMKTITAFDIESTGVDVVKDRMVSLSMIKFSFPDFKIKEKRYTLINPLIPIQEGATEVHGITNEMVVNAPTFSKISRSVYSFISSGDYILTHNGKKFDLSMLHEEFSRCGIEWNPLPMIDTFVIMANMIPRTLEGAYRYYCGREIQGAHNAESDVLTTIEVLKGQIEKHDLVQLESNLISLSCYDNEDRQLDYAGKIKLNKQGIAVWTFGKNVNLPVISDLNYCEWFLRSDFPTNSKNILISLLNNK